MARMAGKVLAGEKAGRNLTEETGEAKETRKRES
jgi:hypothetical protein